jgi:oligopeptide transport system substrate-binding protein
MLTTYSFPVLPMHVIQKYGSQWTQPANFVGNGPFKISEWVPNDHITFVPNETYWDKDNINFSKVTFKVIVDENTAYQMYLNGELDWHTSVPTALIDQVKLRSDYQNAPMLDSRYIYFNLQHPLFKDVRVRQALSMSFDRKVITDSILKNGAIPAYGIVPTMDGYTAIPGLGFDVAKAKSLLAAAYADDPTLKAKLETAGNLSMQYPVSETIKAIYEYIQQEWKNQLGVVVDLNQVEYSTWLATRAESQITITRGGWTADYLDPQNYLDMFADPKNSNNTPHYDNQHYRDILAQTLSMPNNAQRTALLTEAENMIVVENPAVIPLYINTSNNLIDLTKYEGWYPNNMNVHPWNGFKLK